MLLSVGSCRPPDRRCTDSETIILVELFFCLIVFVVCWTLLVATLFRSTLHFTHTCSKKEGAQCNVPDMRALAVLCPCQSSLLLPPLLAPFCLLKAPWRWRPSTLSARSHCCHTTARLSELLRLQVTRLALVSQTSPFHANRTH